MRPTIPRSPRRRSTGSGSATRIAKGGRSGTSPVTGGPVAPEASYVSRRTRVRRPGGRQAGTIFPRRRPAPFVRRAVFAVLLTLAMALLTVSYRGGAVLHGPQMAVLQVVAPIERGLARAWDPIAGAWSWGGRLLSATSENPKLKRENAELREQVRVAHDQQSELARLQRALGFKERARFPVGYDKVMARVSSRSPGAGERSLVIDRGSRDGISVDDAVLVTGGLIGRVISVTDDVAVVGLILDDSQQVSVAVSGSEATGVLRTVSTEGAPVMQMIYVKQSAKVEPDDLVVTSGFSSGELHSVYPGGIPIGSVTNVGNDLADVHKTVQVEPFADFDRIDEVFVLVPAGSAHG